MSEKIRYASGPYDQKSNAKTRLALIDKIVVSLEGETAGMEGTVIGGDVGKPYIIRSYKGEVFEAQRVGGALGGGANCCCTYDCDCPYDFYMPKNETIEASISREDRLTLELATAHAELEKREAENSALLERCEELVKELEAMAGLRAKNKELESRRAPLVHLLRTLDTLTGSLNTAQQEFVRLKGEAVVELELGAEVDRLRALVREQEATIAALRAGAKMDAAPQEDEVAQLARCHRCRVDLYEDEYQCGACDMCESCCGCEREGEYI